MSTRILSLFALGAVCLSWSAVDARHRSGPRPPRAFRFADASFRCRLGLDDFRGDQPFEVRVLAGHKVVHARSRDEARRPGVQLYWRGADQKWHPWGTLTTERLRDKCRHAERLERSYWPLNRLFDGENAKPYLAGRLLCADGAPRAVQVARGHGPKPRRRVICELPAYLRGTRRPPGASAE